MSRLTLGHLFHAKNHPALKVDKKFKRKPTLDKPAPRVVQRLFGRKFDAPKPAGPSETPTPLPPRSAAAATPQAIPNVGNDAPASVPYPTAASEETGSWFCCCPACPSGPVVDEVQTP